MLQGVFNFGRMLQQIALIVALASIAFAFKDNDLYGISHIGMTVKNLELSTKYYQDVFGAMLVEDLSTGDEGVSGDSHYYRIFQKELLENQNVPNIRTSGTHEVRWNFLLMNNFMIMLMEFRDRATRQVYFDEHLRVGNAFVGSNHACLIANQDVVPLQQVESILEEQTKITEMDADKKNFIAYFGPEPNNFAERNARPLNTKLTQGASTRGPVGEKWEITYGRGSRLLNDLQPFCENKGVFSALLDIPPENVFQKILSQRMGGLHHMNHVVEDTEKTISFYTTILGGKLNKRKSMSGIPISKFFYDLIHQDEILEAKKQGVSPDLTFGIMPPIFQGAGQPRLDVAFITFDNAYIEPYRYYINSTYKEIPSYLYRTRISPAYVNVIHAGFWVKENVNMSTFIKNMESKSSQFGLDKVKANRAIAVGSLGQAVNDNQYSDPFPNDHHLAGFDYTFFKGPSNEQNVLVQFKGKAKNVLQAAMEKYGALSTAFPSTNPWNWAGFKRTCEWIEESLKEMDDDDDSDDNDDNDNNDDMPSSAVQSIVFLPLLMLSLFLK